MSDGPVGAADDERVLVFAPIGRDAMLTESLLAGNAVRCKICATVGELIRLQREAAHAEGRGWSIPRGCASPRGGSREARARP